jgi:hypothetical protein
MAAAAAVAAQIILRDQNEKMREVNRHNIEFLKGIDNREIPTFDGNNVRNYIEKVKMFVRTYNLPTGGEPDEAFIINQGGITKPLYTYIANNVA